MPLTNYPQGLSSFGVPLIGSGPILTTGRVLFVNNAHGNASNGNTGESPDKPLSTIDFAVGRCSANNGDYIVVGPGHIEDINGTGALTVDVAGVTIVGIGSPGARPKLRFSATSSELDLVAAGCTLQNLDMDCSIDAVTGAILVSAPDNRLFDVTYTDGSAQQTIRLLRTSTLADRLHLNNFRVRGDAAAGGVNAIQLNGCDDVIIENCFFDGNYSSSIIEIITTACLDLEVRNVVARQRNAADLFLKDTITGSTGMIGPNLFLRLADDAANITEAITGATFTLFDPIYVVNAANEKAMLINWTASTDA